MLLKLTTCIHFLLQSVCFGTKLVFDYCGDKMVNSILTLPKVRRHGFDLTYQVWLNIYACLW
jgi:hypothetical protein